MARAVLAVTEVRKHFAGVTALDGVSIQIQAAEVRGIVGENGAGKSTLIKVIAGVLWPDSGSVVVDGQLLVRANPMLASKLGIAVIHQERQIAPDVSVMENVLCGELPTRRFGMVDWGKAARLTSEQLHAIGLDVDPRCRAGALSVAEHQQIEIARALMRDARLVIMDEPTASLTSGEIDKLFGVVRRLQDTGCAVLYISHHLDEVFAVADAVTVMRDGQIVATEPMAALDHDRLASLMFGTEIATLKADAHGKRRLGVPALNLDRVAVDSVLRDITFAVREGEVVCVTGGVGSGRRELARCIAGVMRPTSGEIWVRGAVGLWSPRRAALHGLGFLPGDRKREGLMGDLDVAENVDVTRLNLQRNPLASGRMRHRRVAEVLTRLNVTYPRLTSPVTELSGGNQQKAVLARLFNIDAKVVVLDEPTAGVDIRTKIEIYKILHNLAKAGAAVLVFSSDYDEIEVLADRALVLKRGRISGDYLRQDISRDRLQHAAS